MVDIIFSLRITINVLQIIAVENSENRIAVSIGHKNIFTVCKRTIYLDSFKIVDIRITAVAVKDRSAGIRAVNVCTCCPIEIVTIIVLIEHIVKVLCRIVSDITVYGINGFI